MKKYLGALLAGGMVFGLVMGSAAALDINNVAPLQVGVTAEGALECDSDGVDVLVGFQEQSAGAYDPANESSTRSSSSVIVSDIDPDCEDAYLVAFALDADGNELAKGLADTLGDSEYDGVNGTWADDQTVEIPWNHRIDPKLVERVELHLNG